MRSLFDFIHNFSKTSPSIKIISISGESGTGKTTLALQIASHFLFESTPNCGIWIQASELFPYKRFKSLFQKNPQKLFFLEKNILVTPKSHTFSSYNEQSEFLIKLCSNDAILPLYIKFIVVDNISHHLRYEISNYSEVQKISNLLDRFFEEQLFPLICFCQRENIFLLLIHESSYDLTLGRNRSFYSKLYDRIKALSIVLSIDWNQNQKAKVLKIYYQNKIDIINFRYTINQEGICLTNHEKTKEIK